LHVYTVYVHYTLSLADFSAINYCLKLSQTLHLHTSKLSPETYSANSLLQTATWQLLHSHSGNCFLRAALVELLPKTNCLDISILLINPQSYERRELCCVTVFTAALPRKRACCRVTSSRLRAENLDYRQVPSNSVASSNKGLTCAVAWRHRGCAEKTPTPLTAAQRVFGRELFSGQLPSNAPLRNPCRATQQLVDMSQYISHRLVTGLIAPVKFLLSKSEFINSRHTGQGAKIVKAHHQF
jgi:hypothetical protein